MSNKFGYTGSGSGGGISPPAGDIGGSTGAPTVNELLHGGIVPARPDITLISGTSVVAVDTALKPVYLPIIPQGGMRRFPLAAVRIFVGGVAASAGVGVAIYSIVFSGAQTFTATKVADVGGAAGTGIIDCSASGNASKSANVGPPGGAAAVVTLDFTQNIYYLAAAGSTVTTLTYGQASRLNHIGAFRLTGTIADVTGASFATSLTQASVQAVAQGTTAPAVSLITTAGLNGFS